MKAAILGNGPSRIHYNSDDIYDIVIGCNIPWATVDATIICDQEIVDILKKDLTLIQVPVIISNIVYERMKELRIVDEFTVLKVFKPKDWHNSALYAVDYLMEQQANEIHVYGCDSIFENDISSTTDKHLDKKMDSDMFLRHWRKEWHKKMQSEIDFKIFKSTK